MLIRTHTHIYMYKYIYIVFSFVPIFDSFPYFPQNLYRLQGAHDKYPWYPIHIFTIHICDMSEIYGLIIQAKKYLIFTWHFLDIWWISQNTIANVNSTNTAFSSHRPQFPNALPNITNNVRHIYPEMTDTIWYIWRKTMDSLII